MGLQERSLTLNILIENQETVLVIQNSSVLAQIVSEGIVIAVETDTRAMHMSMTSHIISYIIKSVKLLTSKLDYHFALPLILNS